MRQTYAERYKNAQLSFSDYQKKAFETALPSAQRLDYMTLGLVSEAGEIAGKVKKLIRDNEALQNGQLSSSDPSISEKLYEIKKEIGDVCWYVAGLATVLGVDLEDLARQNLEKLADRKARGAIQGSGDNR